MKSSFIDNFIGNLAYDISDSSWILFCNIDDSTLNAGYDISDSNVIPVLLKVILEI